ncbi:hypothetical protein ERJ75_000050200 [Trypanosoma vivax]|uniref:Uncharacterized protein n=1 Tax=Trypanosoma vivax (strain Y486) TaxID=1055687 RepID=G0U773_TRYVY|nr:hypothetical protein TRVL_01440 [Trypanosoma vivax]KAH8620517.1 hypothetical protein ERJ75_000050200 [Trypanosoma vivax]CCC51730.1 conserved hypothetical protein [Trypanosoma vivax Y486]
MLPSCPLRAAVEYGRRLITLPVLLDTVRRDPGMTALYYANRYFGKDRLMEVTRVLWGELKLHGQVTIDRIDGPEEPPRWYPVFSMPQKLHRIRLHRPEEEDLSVLQREPETPRQEMCELSSSLSMEVENSIIQLVHSLPNHDIQFYIGELPARMRPYAPSAFRRLREAEIIVREQTPQGTFIWK